MILRMGDDAQESSAPTMALEGQRIGNRYQLLGLLGTGGMGRVYKVRDTELDEEVALKMLDSRLLTDTTMVERFRREVKLARRVTHRHVARTFDIGEHEGEKFLTMELLDGEPLAGLIMREGAQPIPRAIEIAVAIAEGLAAAHAVGVVHRDLKPENVVLTRDGRVVVADFGLAVAAHASDNANLTQGFTLGTPAYMAPEQVEGLRDLDGRADLYALGLILYELLTGERAWQGTQPLVLAAARLMHPPPDPTKLRPNLPAPLRELIARLLEKRREDRPADAPTVARALLAIEVPLGSAQTVAVATSAAAVARTPGRTPQATGDAPARTTTPFSTPRQAAARTVAVLPFARAKDDDDYLADGLTDDVIDTLSMTSGLRVRPRGAVFKFRGSHDPREVGRELGVDVVIEGSVRRSGPLVRVSTRVLSVADGFQLWAQRFDRPEGEMLQVSDEIARAIAAALTVKEAPPERDAPSDPTVISFFLRARHELRKYWGSHMRRATELFSEALAIAPDEPLLLAGFALATARAWSAEGKEPPEQVERAIAQARVMAPHLGETYVASAFLHLGLGQPEAAMRDLRDAITRSPALPDAPDLLGRILIEVGATDEGIKRLEAAALLDPELEVSSAAEIARAHSLLGNHELAAGLMERMQPRNPSQAVYAAVTSARLAFWRRDVEALRKLPLNVSNDPSGFARGLAQIVETGEGSALHDVMRARAETRGLPARHRAFSYQLLAELSTTRTADDIIAAIESAYSHGLFDIVWIEKCPLLDVARSDPRFQPLVDKVRARAAAVLTAWRTAG